VATNESAEILDSRPRPALRQVEGQLVGDVLRLAVFKLLIGRPMGSGKASCDNQTRFLNSNSVSQDSTQKVRYLIARLSGHSIC